MATTNRGYATPATGTEIDTWGDVLNTNFGLIDSNLGNVLSLAATSGGAVTLNATQAANGTIIVTGSIASNYTITFPAVQGWWKVVNLTTGAGAVILTASGSASVLGIPPGMSSDILVDGTNLIDANPRHYIGEYVRFASTAVPSWITSSTVPPYLYCGGSTFSAVTYPYLNTLLGTTTLPDLKGRSPASLNDGTGRITTAVSGIDGNTRFSAGGSQSITLDTTQIPAHSHGVVDPGHTHTTNPSSANVIGSGAGGFYFGSGGNAANVFSINSALTGITISNTGGGLAHINMHPVCIDGIVMIRAA